MRLGMNGCSLGIVCVSFFATLTIKLLLVVLALMLIALVLLILTRTRWRGNPPDGQSQTT